MAAIKPVELIAEKWATVTPGRAPEYEKGVRNPVRDYATNAIAADAAWKAGVQAAIQGNRFTAGVRKVGTQKWQSRSIELGTPRYGPGVVAARADYQAGFAPFREAIAQVTLPPRGPRRAPQNLQRVNAIVQALSARKEALLRGA